MPKPTSPWTTSRALESYVYVLPDRYVPQTSGDTSPLFHAKVGDSTHAIRTGDVRNFLEDHRDRTLVAYDALAFHLNCLQAVGDDSSTLWNFSRTHRLWDITLIERRIRYAHVGFAAPIQGREGLENIIRERLESQAIPTDISDMLVALRNILCKQVNWALKNLPLFQTYRADGDIPRPVTIDEYCNRLDAARFVQYRHMSFLPGQDIDRSPAGLYHSSLFRRRDLILTGASGPFGVGIDVQSAIVAHSIDCLSRKDIRPKLTQKSIIYVKTATDRSSQNLNKTSIRNCFHWSDGGDGRNYVTSNNNGNLELFIDRWQRCLHAVWENRPSFITASHTYPKGTDDEISVCPEDWLDYRFLGSPITDWLELEGAASLLHSCTNSTLFSYNAFPVLRSLVPETLSDSDVEGILQAAPNGTFIVIRWVKLLESSLVASVFSAYLLHRRYETQEQYARRFAPIFSPIIPPTFDHDLFLLENDFTDYIRPDYIRPLFSLILQRRKLPYIVC